jgi:hypothetical protein
MKNRILETAVSAFALGVVASGAAAASPVIDDAKSKCVVGEQSDGYLGVIDSANASDVVRREVRAINQQRKAVYADLAARNGVTIEDAAALTAERLLNSAPSGQCIQTPEGSWVKKP